MHLTKLQKTAIASLQAENAQKDQEILELKDKLAKAEGIKSILHLVMLSPPNLS